MMSTDVHTKMERSGPTWTFYLGVMTVGSYDKLFRPGLAALLLTVLGDAARARGMTQVAEQSGLTREALYKALRPTSRPQFSTVARVMRALGIRLVAQVEQTG